MGVGRVAVVECTAGMTSKVDSAVVTRYGACAVAAVYYAVCAGPAGELCALATTADVATNQVGCYVERRVAAVGSATDKTACINSTGSDRAKDGTRLDVAPVVGLCRVVVAAGN